MVDKASARDRMVELLQQDPAIGAAEAGRALDISRQRAHKLLEDLRPEIVGATAPRLRVGAAGGSRHFTVAILLVAVDLTDRGWQVFMPTTPHNATCDLVAVSSDGAKVQRIEVRTAKRRLEEIEYTEPRGGVFDRLALVITGEPVLYRPAFR